MYIQIANAEMEVAISSADNRKSRNQAEEHESRLDCYFIVPEIVDQESIVLIAVVTLEQG